MVKPKRRLSMNVLSVKRTPSSGTPQTCRETWRSWFFMKPRPCTAPNEPCNCCDSKACRERARESEGERGRECQSAGSKRSLSVALYLRGGTAFKQQSQLFDTSPFLTSRHSRPQTRFSQIPDDILTGGLSDWSARFWTNIHGSPLKPSEEEKTPIYLGKTSAEWP
ncbi:hypothetical protein JOB18_035425 [Solea senegalensis]|uniref:Uncharacterized protein n=1 Tax=Solea senegalensis TaxID=28829 RepID=A0AAV6S210_SOLSE|nr:hypothetical protein JOB18_035425 [Solea senegalensis]